MLLQATLLLPLLLLLLSVVVVIVVVSCEWCGWKGARDKAGQDEGDRPLLAASLLPKGKKTTHRYTRLTKAFALLAWLGLHALYKHTHVVVLLATSWS